MNILKGSGTITKVRSGRYWARSPLIDGVRKPLGTWATYDEARAKLDAFIGLHGKKEEVSFVHLSLAKFGTEVLQLRELEGVRGADEEQRLWTLRIVPTALGAKALTEIAPVDVAAWTRELAKTRKDGTRIKRPTVLRAKTVLSSVCSEAVQRGLIPSNPCTGIEVRARADEAAKDVRTVLTPDEQQRLLTCEQIPEVVRLMIAVALFTGIRPGEVAHNFLRDLHVDEAEPFLFVRFGSQGKVPKGGKTRRVPLLPGALSAIKRWLEIRWSTVQKKKKKRGETGAEVRKDPGLIFVSPRGTARNSEKLLGGGKEIAGKWVDPFKRYCAMAGIEERPGLVWYCLRHSCATSLLEGWWGPAWSLEEVCEMMGHSSISVTEGYIHSTGYRLRGAVSRMPLNGYAVVTPSAAVIHLSAVKQGSRESGLNRRPALYESLNLNNDLGTLEAMSARFQGSRSQLSENEASAAPLYPPVKQPASREKGKARAEQIMRLLKEGRTAEALALAKDAPTLKP